LVIDEKPIMGLTSLREENCSGIRCWRLERIKNLALTSQIGKGRQRCAIARSDKAIETIVVSGTRPDAVYSAIVYLAIHTQPDCALVIHLDIDSAIHSLCYAVGPLYLHASLKESSPLAAAARSLSRRTAPTSLVPVNEKVMNLAPWKACVRAANGHLPGVPSPEFSIPKGYLYLFPLAPSHSTTPPLPDFTKPKVFTTLPPTPKVTYSDRTAQEILKDTPYTSMPTDVDPRLNAHRGRHANRLKQHRNLQALEAVRTPGELWRLKRWWTDPKACPESLTLGVLKDDFQERMNPPSTLPDFIDQERFENDHLQALQIPEHTVDTTPKRSFSRPFTSEEVTWAKSHIKKRPAKSARGIDGVSYRDLVGISSDKLRDLYNLCISRNQVPNPWTMSTLVAIPKPRIPLKDPKSYRIISLNSCVGKVW
jgi:hypothetical protein